MNISLKPLLMATLLAAAALSSQAESGGTPPAANGPTGRPCESHGHGHAGFKAHMARHASALKSRLKLSPEQESAWTAYIAAMKPPADFKRPDRAEIGTLATPERLDRMRELRQQREAWFGQRDAATRNFYAILDSEQKKTFDEAGRRHFHRGAWERTQR